jgi:Mg-chelatase subunit ChlD
MRIAIMVDTSDAAAPALNHLRASLVAFADAIAPQHELMLVSMGRQVRVRVQPTTDRKKFKDAASALFPDGGGEPLMDALLETDDRFMRKAEDRWPVFVIVTADGTEASAGAHEKKFNDWVVALPSRGIAAHAVVVKYRGGALPEIVANHVALTAGGVYEYINTSNSLPEKLKAIADQVSRDYERASTKYEVTFTTDTAGGPVMVGVAREGVKIETTQGRLR